MDSKQMKEIKEPTIYDIWLKMIDFEDRIAKLEGGGLGEGAFLDAAPKMVKDFYENLGKEKSK